MFLVTFERSAFDFKTSISTSTIEKQKKTKHGGKHEKKTLKTKVTKHVKGARII